MSARDDTLAPEALARARRPLEQAATLPAEAYTSPAVYARECERIFAREWLCAGRADQIPAAGDYFALDLLGDRLVVLRGLDDRVRVLSRVCRHRGAELVQGSGNTRSLSCPYHAWTYRLDGTLAGAPYMEEATGFDRARCRLPELRCELWEGWIFVSFDPEAEPLAPRLAPLSRMLAGYRMADMVAVETATFDSPFNWKVLVDNFMEAYHHIAIHRDTFEPLFPAAQSWAPENEGPYSMLVMPPREGRAAAPEAAGGAEEGAAGLPSIPGLSPEESQQLVAAVVYPFHLFAPSAHGLTWYQLLPDSGERFQLRIFTCLPREALDEPRHAAAIEALQAFTRLVHEQDIRACEATWAGLRARSFTQGVLGPLEKPIWQFNQWWLERMADGI